MSVCVVRVKHLRLANFLQRCTRPQHQLNWHLVENFIAICRVVCQIQHRLHRANPSSCIGPFMDGICNLLQRPPVDEDGLLALRSEVSKLVLLHPLANFFEWVHRQASVKSSVLADRARVQLSKTDLINATWLGICTDEIGPHFHLALSCVDILLNCIKEGPSVILWHLKCGFDHFIFALF